MKIECPSCHLSGNINEIELPGEGKNFRCPRCRESFFVGKPDPPSDGKHLMNMCPVCQYSTFTDEMFAVCPKCGTSGADYQEMLRAKAKAFPHGPGSETTRPEETPAELDREQLLRDYEMLTRSRRNPDFDPPAALEKAAAKKPALPLPIRITGWALVAAGALFLMYGLAGLRNYYGRDLQTTLSFSYLEPGFSFRIFFEYGFFPWVRTIFGIVFVAAASQFFFLRNWAPKTLKGMCWGGIGIVLVQEVARVVNRFIITSGSPSPLFYVDCLISFMLTAVFWSVPFVASMWLISRDGTMDNYRQLTET